MVSKPNGDADDADLVHDEEVVFQYASASEKTYYTWKEFLTEVNTALTTQLRYHFGSSAIQIEESGYVRERILGVPPERTKRVVIQLDFTPELAKYFRLSEPLIKLTFPTTTIAVASAKKLTIPSVLAELRGKAKLFKFNIDARNYDAITSLIWTINCAMYQADASVKNQVQLKWMKEIARVEWECKLNYAKLDVSQTLSKLLGFTKTNIFTTRW